MILLLKIGIVLFFAGIFAILLKGTTFSKIKLYFKKPKLDDILIDSGSLLLVIYVIYYVYSL